MSPSARAWIALARVLAAVWLVWASPVRGADRATIVAVVDEEWTSILPRLRAELASAGFKLVIVTPPRPEVDRRDLELLAQREGAVGALSLLRSQPGPQVWVVDPSSGRTVFRDDISGFSNDDRTDAIAVRMVETLRATMLQVESPHAVPVEPPPPPREILIPPPTAHAPWATSSRWALRVTGGAGYSVGGVGVTDHVGASFVWRTTPRLRFALDGALTPVQAKVSGPEGQASIGLYLAGLSFGYSLLDPNAAARLRSGAGLWIGVVTMKGEAQAGYLNQRATIVAAVPHADLSFEIPLSRRLAVGLGLSLGTSAPGAAVQFAGRRVATWGRPFGLGLLAVESSID